MKNLLSSYGLQAVTDSFGPKRVYWQSYDKTDMEIVIDIAKEFGRDVYCFGNKVYIKRLMDMHKEEHVYEKGKSLLNFDVTLSLKDQINGVCVLGHNWQEARSFRGTAMIADSEQRIGGRMEFTKALVRDQQCFRQLHYEFDHKVKDAVEAKERAEAILREKSFKLLTGEAEGEGNPELKAGATVMLKYIGKIWSGEYIAKVVVHDFSVENGYRTRFYVKRNMLDEGIKPPVSHVDMYAARAAAVAAANNQTEESEEEEDENSPEFRKLIWRNKNNKEITEALVDDEVILYCEVKNIEEAETVDFRVYEYDDDGEHDHITDLSGVVKDGRVEVRWTVEYHADDDDTNSAQEIEEQGYTLPEYIFTVKYNGVEQQQGEEKVLYVKANLRQQLLNKDTGEIWANSKYTLILPDGSRVKGKTNEDGYVEPVSSPIGNVAFFIHKEKG